MASAIDLVWQPWAWLEHRRQYEDIETRVALNMTLAICAARLIDTNIGPMEGE